MTSRVRPERKGYDVIIYQQHMDRLKKMQPTVDSGPPRPHPLSNKREMDQVTCPAPFALSSCSLLTPNDSDGPSSPLNSITS